MQKNSAKKSLTPQWLTDFRVEIVNLKKELSLLEAFLMDPKPMKKGSLTIQYRKCGKSSCKCMDENNPKRHGPYYFLVVKNDGKTVRQKYLKSKKEVNSYVNYRAYNKRLTEYKTTQGKIHSLFEKIRDRKSKNA